MLSLKGGVAPGGDGLPIEWYKTFWPLIGEDILNMYMYREVIGEVMLPGSACTGHITLDQKKGERADLSNWCLITLLCVDYKFLAKALALQLRGVIGSVVHRDQTCGVHRRSAGLNLSPIQDVIAWAQYRRPS